MDMEIATRTADKITVVEVSGFIDGKTAPDFQEKVLQVMQETDTVLIDLGQVSFMSSAGLRAMLVTYRATQESKTIVALAGLPEEIKDNMEATGFITFFKIFETIEAGLKELS
jgi:anti-sigma B factor antagonist